LAGFLKLAKFVPAVRRPGPAIEAAQSDLRVISASFLGKADADATIKQVDGAGTRFRASAERRHFPQGGLSGK
jgi:hypothetical protein